MVFSSPFLLLFHFLPNFMSLIVQKDVEKKVWVPGKMLMASMDGQETLGKVLCWAYFVTIYLDAAAARFVCFFFKSSVNTHTYPN